ncbi:MAG: TRAP transporter fused permease subunit [Tepidanaerobacter acetatoxydans]|uniref:TRAP transporter permease n=1 Tax=Tepidanaerobacter TaxID=499228 RepID=UPI000A6784B1|nr:MULTISPECIES: TRAP transporter fused permease subunit [Tepidanaerobacter]NLU10019.1 TRAP transporter fused permease subunit [Tepidanaerobacter acetatoxydans]
MKDKIAPRAIASIIVSIIWLLFQLYIAVFVPFHPILQSPLHLLFALTLVFINNPIDKSCSKKWVKLIDITVYIGIIYGFYYFISQTYRLQTRVPYISEITPTDIIAMLVVVAILLEAVRRVFGIVLLSFISVFIVYAWFGKYIPGLLSYKGTNLNQFTELMIMGPDGIFGAPLATTANSIFYFIIFGVLFSVCGGGGLLIDVGMKFSGKTSGGPAKAAVISSALLGMVSGSAVANVSTTGVMTIPMMKKVGYKPEQAAAIEAVASTGGQIMPPIMGIGAFIMAEMLGIKYGKIAMSALIPASAYFISIFLLVDFIARKQKISEQEVMTDFNIEPIIPRLYLLIPVCILVGYILKGASLMRAGMAGIVSVLVINFISKFVSDGKNYASVNEIGKALIQGTKQASEIAIPTAACGIIIGIVIQSGFATKLSSVIAKIGSGSLATALIIAATGCILLGMALPTVAAYLVSNVLFVPVIIKLGVDPLPANMFVFYFGIIAQITPPVCVASFTAAGIAGADSWKTGWTAFNYAIVAFLIPFVFVYNPGILLIGTVTEIIKSTLILIFGTYILAGGVAGYFFIPLERIWERTALIGTAILLIIPETITSIIGIVLGIVLILFFNTKKRKSKSTHGRAYNEAAQ